MRTALTIAGSDSSGGAGIQAEIKTMTINGVYAMSAITALTAQNTVGFRSIMEST
ncbi:MAG: bifunctional hydroxymethylpyrimidine kinase/phosphomethylpyrimidine kinase, partial [Clostridia bacterium]|nr:bifunctional hydroxymethylpyrimidine kinase/phosphomethylpyrimidine kinase [Clostridia bacterium]